MTEGAGREIGGRGREGGARRRVQRRMRKEAGESISRMARECKRMLRAGGEREKDGEYARIDSAHIVVRERGREKERGEVTRDDRKVRKTD